VTTRPSDRAAYTAPLPSPRIRNRMTVLTSATAPYIDR
jgi:hypothetical protein